MDTRNENTKKLIDLLNQHEDANNRSSNFKINGVLAEQALTLLEHGGDVNATSTRLRFHLLHVLVYYLDGGLLHNYIKILVETHGANITATDLNGFTPFAHYLSKPSFNIAVLDCFLHYGDNLHTHNFFGETVLHKLVLMNPVDSNSLHKIKTWIRYLAQDYYFDMHSRNKSGLTALECLMKNSNFNADMALLLVDFGADPNTKIDNVTMLDILSNPLNNQDGRNNSIITHLKEKIAEYKEREKQEQNLLLDIKQNNTDELTLDREKNTQYLCYQAIEAIQYNTSIRTLSLFYFNFNPNEMEVLIKAINESQISRLALKKCLIHKDGQINFGNLLSTNTKLMELEFAITHFVYPDLIKTIAEKLSVNKTLLNLTIEDPNLDVSGAKLISDALTKNNTLQSLDLTENYIEKEAIVSLLSNTRNPNLKIICDDIELFDNKNTTIFLTIEHNKLEIIKNIQPAHAIKCYNSEVSIMTELAQNKAPYVIEIYNYKIAPEDASSLASYNIYMEFMPNGTLSEAIKSNVASLDGWLNKQNILLKIAIGLSFIHQYGIIHRDIKCSNILFDANWSPKIADFGASTKNPRSGFYGTTHFASPETIRKIPQTAKSDIFSYGIVSWCLLTMQSHPYKKVEEQEIIALRLANHRPEIPVTCPVKIKDILRLCWHSDPAKRPTSQELIPDLQSNVDGKLSENMTLKLKNM
jgi:hypothetical protein